MQTDDWFKCYGKMWIEEIVSGAYCHPAKFSRALIRHIYAHAIEEEWIKTGGMVVDPFGGVGLGALEAMRRGLHWFGMELEANYCALAQQNIDLWNERYSTKLPNWGTATILQGDSRQLASRLARASLPAPLQAGLCLGSPPYTGFTASDTGFRPPHARAEFGRDETAPSSVQMADKGGYGQTAGNLGNLPDTDFKAALAQMPKGSHAAILEETGAEPTTFWSASREILEQVYQILVPGGYAIFVCKRFVRDKQIVEFPTQWAHLCEAVGLEWIHHHKAWQVDKRGAQYTLGGELEERQITWQSFFRKDHAKKYPRLKILWEDILCFVKRP